VGVDQHDRTALELVVGELRQDLVAERLVALVLVLQGAVLRLGLLAGPAEQIAEGSLGPPRALVEDRAAHDHAQRERQEHGDQRHDVVSQVDHRAPPWGRAEEPPSREFARTTSPAGARTRTPARRWSPRRRAWTPTSR